MSLGVVAADPDIIVISLAPYDANFWNLQLTTCTYVPVKIWQKTVLLRHYFRHPFHLTTNQPGRFNTNVVAAITTAPYLRLTCVPPATRTRIACVSYIYFIAPLLPALRSLLPACLSAPDKRFFRPSSLTLFHLALVLTSCDLSSTYLTLTFNTS
jgi:hypothetical protein